MLMSYKCELSFIFFFFFSIHWQGLLLLPETKAFDLLFGVGEIPNYEAF